MTGQGPRIRSPLLFRGFPAGLQTNYLPPPLAPQRAPEPEVLPEPIRTALYSYCRLRAVTSAMAAAAPGSQHSATPYHTPRNAASPRSRRAGTTQERRTGNGEKPALFRFRVARRKCRWGASPAGRRRFLAAFWVGPANCGSRNPGTLRLWFRLSPATSVSQPILFLYLGLRPRAPKALHLLTKRTPA